jgi:Domain of unknown function (DUF3844)
VSNSAPSSRPASNDKVVSYSPLAGSAAFSSRYLSQAACEKGTGNCTLHGSCAKVGSSENSEHATDYWGCVCKPHVVKVSGGGQQTTLYGGLACEKVDMAQPFWLLAAVTIGLVSAIATGIGMLYSIGSEELPSVIGAGVSSARK